MFGQYIAAATNDPSKYPDKPFLHEDNQPSNSIDDFMKMAKQRYSKKD